MKTKENFHKLIDEINDEEALLSYYNLIERLNNKLNGKIWDTLNEAEKKELLVSFDESFYEENLVKHSVI